MLGDWKRVRLERERERERERETNVTQVGTWRQYLILKSSIPRVARTDHACHAMLDNGKQILLSEIIVNVRACVCPSSGGG